MTMHLEGPWLSTTNTRARGERTTKAQREQLERDWRERNVRLRNMGLPKESFEQFLEWVYGRGKAVASKKSNTYEITTSTFSKSQKGQGTSKERNSSYVPTTGLHENTQTKSEVEHAKPVSLGSWITGPCSSKPSPTYTGTKVKGIGTMHKSNAVPIFSDEEAIDISTMRR